MIDEKFLEAVNKILEKDSRYSPEAYDFIRNAVTYTAEKLERRKDSENKHVSACELLQGVIDYASEQYGPFAREVLFNWGLTDALSVGSVVFNMIGEELLAASPDDSINDFKINFNFEKAFTDSFAASNPGSNLNPPIIIA